MDYMNKKTLISTLVGQLQEMWTYKCEDTLWWWWHQWKTHCRGHSEYRDKNP